MKSRAMFLPIAAILFIGGLLVSVSLNCEKSTEPQSRVIPNPPPPEREDTVFYAYPYQQLETLMEEDAVADDKGQPTGRLFSVMVEKQISYQDLGKDREMKPAGDCSGSGSCSFVCKSFKQTVYLTVFGVPSACHCTSTGITCNNGCASYRYVCRQAGIR